MRHASTVGRAQSSIKVSGPPLTWENNGATHSDADEDDVSAPVSTASSTFSRRGPSASTEATTVGSKSELPPLPASASTPRKFDQQATIRNGAAAAAVKKEASDDYDDDYEDEPNGYAAGANGRPSVDDELPDTTMLDSVVLPAIASVCHLLCVATGSSPG